MARGVFKFGPFELDAARFELRHSGSPVVVQPKVLRLLLHLVAARERSVSTGELLEALWPNENVTPASVKRAVGGARRAVGDAADAQGVIRTVRGHGYQFVAAVEELRLSAVAPPALGRSVAAPDARLIGDEGWDSSDEEGRDSSDEEGRDSFVGRVDLLAWMHERLAGSCAGQGGLTLLGGEAGVGKTRTLHELAARAAEHNMQVWFGRCMEFEGAPAFWPIIQLIREGAQRLSKSQLQSCMGAGAADVARAVPELRRSLAAFPEAPAEGASSAGFRLFDSLAQFIRRAADVQPLLLLLDDLQRADQPTLRFLTFLSRQLDRARVQLVCAFRDGGVSSGSNPALMADLLRAPAVHYRQLSGFDRSEIIAYLACRMGLPVPDAVVCELHDRTAGNPLLLQHLLHTRRPPAGVARPGLRERVGLDTHGKGVHGVFARHLEPLSVACQSLLRSASVLGREFAAAVVAAITERDACQVASDLTDAVNTGLLQALDEPLGRYRFTHALVRDAVYQQLGAAQRARLHARAAQVLLAQGSCCDAGRLTELVGHLVRGVPVVSAEQALHFSLKAADVAASGLAYEESAQWLEQALALLDLAPAAESQRVRLLVDRGEALTKAGDTKAARSVLLHAAELARARLATDELVRALELLARPAESGEIDEPLVFLLKAALCLLHEQDPRLPLLQGLLAKSLSYSRSVGESYSMALSALSAVRTLTDDAIRARVLRASVEALAHPDHRRERCAIASELEGIGRERADSRVLLHAAVTRVWNAVEAGEMAEADAGIETLSALEAGGREPTARWYALAFRAMRAVYKGELVRGEQLAHAAYQQGAVMGEALAHHIHVAQQHGIYQHMGRWQEAEAVVRSISVLHPGLGGWRAVLAGLEAKAGRRDAGRSVLNQLLAGRMDALRKDPFLLSALAPAAELCVMVGDAAQAQQLYQALLPYEQLHGNVSTGFATHGPMARHLGLLAMCSGHLERAEQHLEQAMAICEATGAPAFWSASCIAFGSVLLKRNENGARLHVKSLIQRVQALSADLGFYGLWELARGFSERVGLGAVGTAAGSRQRASLPAARSSYNGPVSR